MDSFESRLLAVLQAVRPDLTSLDDVARFPCDRSLGVILHGVAGAPEDQIGRLVEILGRVKVPYPGAALAGRFDLATPALQLAIADVLAQGLAQGLDDWLAMRVGGADAPAVVRNGLTAALARSGASADAARVLVAQLERSPGAAILGLGACGGADELALLDGLRAAPGGRWDRFRPLLDEACRRIGSRLASDTLAPTLAPMRVPEAPSGLEPSLGSGSA